MKFTKYQGTGNDFIIIDNRDMSVTGLDVEKLCNRRFGIGADGLMLLQETPGFDFDMIYYNSDGKLSSMCGNGGRCLVDFAAGLGVFNGNKTRFKAVDGPHDAVWEKGRVELKMQNVEEVISLGSHHILDTGSPHYVIFSDNIEKINLVDEARAIRYNDRFREKGINVNFVEIINQTQIRVRTYERGVEDETLSCGTGVTASAIALSKEMAFEPGNYEIKIVTPGGDLMVKYNLGEIISDTWLCGPATKVFEGEL